MWLDSGSTSTDFSETTAENPSFQLLTTFFLKNSRKIACQAPKSTNPSRINNIRVAV
jgi:hypothetical protein